MFDDQDIAYIRQAIPEGHVLDRVEAEDTQLLLYVHDRVVEDQEIIAIAKHHVPTTINWLVMFEDDCETLLKHVLYRLV